MRYLIETSHMVAVPAYIEAETPLELRGWVEQLAASKKVNRRRPPIGELTFRFDGPVVHVHFTGQNGKRLRFMRLRAEQVVLPEFLRHRIITTSDAITRR